MLACLALALGAARPARAESDSCISAFEQAQELRKHGKFLAAGEQLIQCSQLSCPAFIVKDCTAWYGEVQASQPSIVLSARKGAQALREVKVMMDGTPLSERMDGRSIPIDPGMHEFTFEAAGEPAVIVSALIIEGEKHKPVVAEFPAPAAEAPPLLGSTQGVSAPASSTSADALASTREVPLASYVLAGVGLAALGGGVALRAIGASEFDDLKSSCRTACEQREVDDVKTKYTLSKVSFGVGGAALVAAGVFYFVHNSKSKDRNTGLVLSPSLTGQGISTSWLGRF